MTNLINRMLSVVQCPPPSSSLRRSQFRAFTTQVPILYFILVTNTLCVALTHQGIAPAFLSTVLPSALCVLAVIRILIWVKAGNIELTDDVIEKKLRQTVMLVVLLGVAFTAWGLSLYPYGDAYAKVHVAFYMSITVIGCIFCLMHLRAAALICTFVVNVPFVIFFGRTGNTVLVAIAINVLLVSLAMVYILLTYYRDFSNLIHSRSKVLEAQKSTQKLSDENFALANLDSLTGLPNRRAFFSDADIALGQSFSRGTNCYIGIVDLDGFKQVNDLYGHSIGDRVIAETGRRLAQFQSASLTIARLGGDEFGLLFVSKDTSNDPARLGELICAALREPFDYDDMTARLSATIGLTQAHDENLRAAQLLDRADHALYYAKEHMRGQVLLFSAEHETRIRRESLLRQSLKSPHLDEELSLTYQPIIDVSAKRIVAYEALARWKHSQLGNVAPSEFIPMAERNGIITNITVTLLTRALKDAMAWPDGRRLSFNLSACDVSCKDAMSRIWRVVKESPFPATRVDFEVTETAVMRDFGQAKESLVMLQSLGAGVSLDDFGTGYSSLNAMHQLPLDKIKIDRSFIGALASDPKVKDILDAVLSFCNKLGIVCVAEGVETEAEARALLSIGYTVMQGYFFGRPHPSPLAVTEFTDWASIEVRPLPLSQTSGLDEARSALH